MLLNHTTPNSIERKPLENESLLEPNIFPPVSHTRSSKKLNNYENESTYSNNSRQNGHENTN